LMCVWWVFCVMICLIANCFPLFMCLPNHTKLNPPLPSNLTFSKPYGNRFPKVYSSSSVRPNPSSESSTDLSECLDFEVGCLSASLLNFLIVFTVYCCVSYFRRLSFGLIRISFFWRFKFKSLFCFCWFDGARLPFDVEFLILVCKFSNLSIWEVYGDCAYYLPLLVTYFSRGWWAVYPPLFLWAASSVCFGLLKKSLSYRFFRALLFVDCSSPAWHELFKATLSMSFRFFE
jgi:hypothetical protein